MKIKAKLPGRVINIGACYLGGLCFKFRPRAKYTDWVKVAIQ